MFDLSQAEACSIWLIDPDGKVRIKAAKGYHERLLATSPDYKQTLQSGHVNDYARGLPIPGEYSQGEGVTGQIASTGQPVRTEGELPHAAGSPAVARKIRPGSMAAGRRLASPSFGCPSKSKTARSAS